MNTELNIKNYDEIMSLINGKLNYYKQSLINNTSKQKTEEIIDKIGFVMSILNLDMECYSKLFNMVINKYDVDVFLSDLAKQYKFNKSKLEESDDSINWELHKGRKNLTISIHNGDCLYVDDGGWSAPVFSYHKLKYFICLWMENVIDAEIDMSEKYF